MENYYAVIMAGGGGTRLWPVSRTGMPKQLLSLIDDRTLFKTTVERLLPIFPLDHIYVSTGPAYIEAMRLDVPEIPAENFIIEPNARDTGPAAALALSVIHKRDPNAIIAMQHADHFIREEAKYLEILKSAYELAANDHIITLGISPTHPSTGFGYIKQGAVFKEINTFTAYESLGFTEKPNVVTATSFLASGKYSWNAGMFVWKSSIAMQEFERQQPDMYDLLEKLEAKIDTPAFQAELATLWGQMPKISIDVAIMENAENMLVIPEDIGWNDVGSWDALFEVMSLDKFGNGIKGEADNHVILDTRKTMIYSERMTVTIGLEDVIIVDTDDVILICHRDRAQDVKEVVNHLKATRRNEYL
ncbi:MAG: sugar phosphate nucleotidyltransferase [Aggregatilineales bacterium]